MKWTENFNSEEFECKCCICDGGSGNVDMRFITKLQRARNIAKIPFHITSGYRCQRRNDEVSKVSKSTHVQGKAVDIKCSGSR